MKRLNRLFNFMSSNCLYIICFIIVLEIILSQSWVADDAFHSFIMARNLAEGNGFVYNIGERVLAVTNPFYTIFISILYFFTKEMYLTSIISQTIISCFAIFIVCKFFVKGGYQYIFTCMLFLFSPSFIVYCTSGLENCVLFLLSGVLIHIVLHNREFSLKKLLLIAFLVSLIAGTRMDAVLFFIPIVVYVFLFKRSKDISFLKAFAIGLTGLSPFIIWELFSLFYYGLLVPNTAVAKLNTGFSKLWYLERGIQYTVVTFLNDIFVVIVPLVSIILSIVSKKRKLVLVASGVFLYFLYLIYIGGDFMCGRHFTVMYYISVILLLEFLNTKKIINLNKKLCFSGLVIMYVYSFLLMSFCGRSYLINKTCYENPNSLTGLKGAMISDEHTWYKIFSLKSNISFYRNNGKFIDEYYNHDDIAKYIPDFKDDQLGFRQEGMELGYRIYIYNSFHDRKYFTDEIGLQDPLVTHFKLKSYKKSDFRVGHIYRATPDDFAESVYYQKNLIKDKSLHKYYDKLLEITRGDLFSMKRIKTIINFNLGKYEYLIDNYYKNKRDSNE